MSALNARVLEYGTFTGLDPICAQRIRQYPDLEAVRDATPDERRLMDPQDLADAGHQWAFTTGPHVLQYCFEAGCSAVRPTPLHGYDESQQMFLLQEFIRIQLPR